MARGIGIAAEDMQHFTTEEKVAAARRAGIKLVKPQLYENMTPEDRGAPLPRTEYSANCWRCRNCGAGVDWRIDSCLLCGYEREKCTICNGTGIIDSGPHPVGCDEPCGCYNGYYYPPADGYCTAGCGAAIKHGAKGMCPSCEAQNAPEPIAIDLMVELTKSLARQKAEAEQLDPNDCAACGDRPAPKDEEGNPLYPRYTHQGKPPVGVCGWCEREGIPV